MRDPWGVSQPCVREIEAALLVDAGAGFGYAT
jgi:hypothetical protein